MKTRYLSRNFKNVSIVFLIAVVFILYGCSVPPSASEAHDVITKHFEGRSYVVVGIAVGDIKALPIRDKKYIEPRTFVVDVPYIELHVMITKGRLIKGMRLTFNDARIKIKKAGIGKPWIVEEISGIPVP